jgi:hypothetical protein
MQKPIRDSPSWQRVFFFAEFLLSRAKEIGAGAGGVATAARLARAGCKVTVVEKNDFSGGRCSLIKRDGYVGKKFRGWEAIGTDWIV